MAAEGKRCRAQRTRRTARRLPSKQSTQSAQRNYQLHPLKSIEKVPSAATLEIKDHKVFGCIR